MSQHPSTLENTGEFPAMSIYLPYTYLIGWSDRNKYYYGVRYASNANPSDLLVSYYTSSDKVHECISEWGLPDIVSIRKTFSDQESAIKWESKVLKRMNCAKDDRFLNMHNNTAFTPLSGDKNPSKRKEVRETLSIRAKNRRLTPKITEGRKIISHKKTFQGLLMFLKKESFSPSKSKGIIARIKKYIDFLECNYPYHKYTIALCRKRLNECETRERKPYPKNRKKSKRGPNQKISKSKVGKKWFYNPLTLENRTFYPQDVPPGYVPGMIKRTPNNNTEEVRKKLSIAMKKVRDSETPQQKNERLKKYHETIQKRKSQKYHAEGCEKSN